MYLVARLAIQLGGIDPNSILRWRESRFLMWLPIVFEASSEVGAQDALTLSSAVWDPKSIRPLLLTADEPAQVTDGAASIAKAEAIIGLIDSGSGESKERLERRAASGS